MQVDLNATIGDTIRVEALQHDEAVLPYVSSITIPAGLHAGTPRVILAAIRRGLAAGVRLGAGVGYRDFLGGGDRYVDVAFEDLYAELIYQIGAVDSLAFTEQGRLSYVRPSGALARMAGRRKDHAEAILRAIASYDPELPLVVHHLSPLLGMARDAGLEVIVEYSASSLERMRASVGRIAADGHPEQSVSLHLDPVTAPVVVRTLRELGHTFGAPLTARRGM
ncbi:LamB/YcsF family protein [Raineyella fluvialis]|uniref:LamB/YcsF family protein n=1 Tax=Raineyella fluvialis TaxID=2662261 RepID=UPI00188DF358|nr:LamB/YcsF family protein [Raineyella fluvialis]